MSFRRAVAALSKGLRRPSQPLISTTLRAITYTPVAGKMNSSSQYGCRGNTWLRCQGAFQWILLSAPAASRSYAHQRHTNYDLFGKGRPGDREFRRTWEKEVDEDRNLWTGSENESDTEKGHGRLEKEIRKVKQQAKERSDLIDGDDSDELWSVWSGSDEEKTLWTGDEGDDDDDIPTEPYPNEKSDAYLDKLFEFDEKPKYRTISELLKEEQEPEELSPGKQARKLAVDNALKKLKKGPDGRYTNVWEVMSDLDILVGAFENIVSGPEYAELRKGGTKRLNMQFFKDIQARMRDPNYKFSPELKLKPKSKLVRRKKWQKAQSRRRKAQKLLFLGLNSNHVLAEDVSANLETADDVSGEPLNGLRKIEDGSVVSNIHTSKWRVFTDTGRDLFLQGKLEDAERLFRAAIEQAKEGFGERDPHVASACNNLAELYRFQNAFSIAEPLYLEAVNILEESFGPDDIRVAAALHNLGQFYLIQQKLDESCVSYKRALKIKRRVLGEGNTDYADTMYHLGRVLYLQGKLEDSQALIQDSIRILEDGGQGESVIFIRRLRYLAQMYTRSNPEYAENIQRKILQKMEVAKGWNSLDTVIAAEGLALILRSVGSLREAQEVLERCLDARKKLLSEDHIQIAANLFHIATVVLLNSSQLKETHISEAITELNKAKNLLGESVRIAQHVLDKLMREGKKKQEGISRDAIKDGHAALMILNELARVANDSHEKIWGFKAELLQSRNTLGTLEITKMGIPGHKEDQNFVINAEKAFNQCISAYKKYGTWRWYSKSSEAKAEYLSCLRHLFALLSDNKMDTMRQSRRTSLQELKDEIRSVEGELSRRTSGSTGTQSG